MQQLGLLRVLLRTSAVAAAAAGAAAVYGHRFIKDDLPEAANNHYVRNNNVGQPIECFLLDLEQGFESTWGRV